MMRVCRSAVLPLTWALVLTALVDLGFAVAPVGTDSAEEEASGGSGTVGASCPYDYDLGFSIGANVLSGPVTLNSGSGRYTADCAEEPLDFAVNGADVGVRWVAPATGQYEITLEGSTGTPTDFDTVLFVFSRAECGVAPLQDASVCNDDAGNGNLWSSISIFVESGSEHTIVITGYGGSEGTFVLNIFNAIGDVPADATICDTHTQCGDYEFCTNTLFCLSCALYHKALAVAPGFPPNCVSSLKFFAPPTTEQFSIHQDAMLGNFSSAKSPQQCATKCLANEKCKSFEFLLPAICHTFSITTSQIGETTAADALGGDLYNRLSQSLPLAAAGGSICSESWHIQAGGWSGFGSWSEWSPSECGTSQSRTRTRTCTDPPPRCGGSTCQGSGEEVASRTADENCCKRDGEWSSFGAWSAWTNAECGGSKSRTRTRSCNSPSASCGGRPCYGTAEEDQCEAIDDLLLS